MLYKMNKKLTIKEAQKQGFIVDTTCYPHIAYKGVRFAPTKIINVYTEEESKFIEAIKYAFDTRELHRYRPDVWMFSLEAVEKLQQVIGE